MMTEHILPPEFVGKTGAGECRIAIPERLSDTSTIEEILLYARRAGATDVHLSTGAPVLFRLHGMLRPQTQAVLNSERLSQFMDTILDGEKKDSVRERGDVEFVDIIEGAGRFRYSVTRKDSGIDITVRLIPVKLFTFEETGMPESCRELTHWAQGLVLITGPIGCGKSTTLSVLTEMINQSRQEHIITIENPVEYVYQPVKCQITQRQIGLHTLSADNALRAALREDPDIIVISELRDVTTIQLAATAAETGHLVLGTMNTNDAAQTVLRVVNSFPAEERSLIQNMISSSLRGVICQQMIPRRDGEGVVPAFEVLMVTSAVANLIRKGSVDQLLRVIATGGAEGMIPFDLSLKNLYKEKVISWEEAYGRCVNKKEFERMKYRSLS